MNLFKWLTNEKYRFFWTKFRNVQKSIWEQDFKVTKSRALREGIRQDRDRALEAIVNVETKIKETKDENILANLDKQKAALIDNAQRYERQMKMVDEQINGIPADDENPGQEGIIDVMKTLAELRTMYKDYLAAL